jgi:hypothetical protein
VGVVASRGAEEKGRKKKILSILPMGPTRQRIQFKEPVGYSIEL